MPPGVPIVYFGNNLMDLFIPNSKINPMSDSGLDHCENWEFHSQFLENRIPFKTLHFGFIKHPLPPLMLLASASNKHKSDNQPMDVEFDIKMGQTFYIHMQDSASKCQLLNYEFMSFFLCNAVWG